MGNIKLEVDFVCLSIREECAIQLLNDIKTGLSTNVLSKDLENRMYKLKSQYSGLTNYESMEILADFAEEELREIRKLKKIKD